MLESGAKHVIMLELSGAIDDVVQRNLKCSGYKNYDLIQCSIDAPPFKLGSIDGIVYCHNVIQHTPSVEKTARALFGLLAPGGEFVFNCYPLNDQGILRWIRHYVIYASIRHVLSHMPFGLILAYAKTMAMLRFVPGIGFFLEKAGFCVRGDVVRVEGESTLMYLKRQYKAAALNTFDCFGSHSFQHHKSDDAIRSLIFELQPDRKKVLNTGPYFSRPTPIGCALRIFR